MTKVDEQLAAAEERYASDPERAELIARSRRFKNSWLELAEALITVRKNGRFADWGYETFEAYTQKELHLRQETVDKLTGSYAFLRKRAPAVLERDGLDAPIPSYQSIDFLRRAEEESGAPENVMVDLRKKVIDDCASVPLIAKEFKDTVFPISAAERKKKDAAGIRNVATRLRDLIAESNALPKDLAVEAKLLLDRVLEAVPRERQEKAA
jgi:hypothetical protein